MRKQLIGLKGNHRKRKPLFMKAIGLILIAFFLVLSFQYFDIERIGKYLKQLAAHPVWLITIFIVYGSAFLFRAMAWRLYLHNKITIVDSLNGLWFSLFLNHLLPFKIGDIARAAVIGRKKEINWDEALHSVIVMRVLDMLVLAAFGLAGFYLLLGEIPFLNRSMISWAILFGTAAALFVIFLIKKMKGLNLIQKHSELARTALFGKNGFLMLSLVVASWVSEGVVVYGVVHIMDLSLSYVEAVWVNSMTVGGQIFQIAPGGIASYEAVMSVLLTRIDIAFEDGYYVALISHGLKFLFSYMVGFYVLIKFPGLWREVKQSLQKGGQKS